MKKRLISIVLVLIFIISILPMSVVASTSYCGRVTADVLNVRSGPGTNYSIVAKLKLNDDVTIIAEQKGWYKLKESRWVSADWVVKDTAVCDDTIFDGRVTADVLNVRSGPGTNYSVVAKLKLGEKVNVKGTQNGWHIIGRNKWVSSDWIVKDTISSVNKERKVSLTVYVTCDVPLNIRSGPGTNYSVVGQLSHGNKVAIIAEQSGWYKMGEKRWVCSQWVSTSNNNNLLQADIDYYSTIPNYGYVDNRIYEKINWNDVINQIFVGEWSGTTTGYGTAGEVLFSLSGFDMYKDVSDLTYYLSHWDNTWRHYLSTGATIISVLPVIGVIKNADEAALVAKQLSKANDLKKFFKAATKTDIIKLATKLDAHTFTRHVGKTESQLLEIRKITSKKSVSTFYNQGLAEEVIEKTLKNNDNQSKIINWLNNSSDIDTLNLNYSSTKTLGFGYFDGKNAAETTKNARVALKKDGKGWFYIITAFPKK